MKESLSLLRNYNKARYYRWFQSVFRGWAATVPGHYPGRWSPCIPAMTRPCRFRFMTGPPT